MCERDLIRGPPRGAILQSRGTGGIQSLDPSGLDSDLGRITNTLVTANGGPGIQIGVGASGNLVEKSYAIGNAGAGIQIEGGGNRASHNPDEDCSPSVACD